MFVRAHEELILYVHERDGPVFGMLTVEKAVIAYVELHSSNFDRKDQSMESVNEYSEGKTEINLLK